MGTVSPSSLAAPSSIASTTGQANSPTRSAGVPCTYANRIENVHPSGTSSNVFTSDNKQRVIEIAARLM